MPRTSIIYALACAAAAVALILSAAPWGVSWLGVTASLLLGRAQAYKNAPSEKDF